MKDEFRHFGDFLYRKRTDKGITLRKFAQAMQVSAPYLSDLENGHRKPLFNYEKLKAASEMLGLTKEEQEQMYDLAGEGRDEVAPDIIDYIKHNAHIAQALRTARENDAQEADWQAFTDGLDARRE